MNYTPDRDAAASAATDEPANAAAVAGEIAPAEGTLARLAVQVEAMRAVLVRLLQDLAEAEHRLEESKAAHLVEANEQLLLAALASQAEADTAAQALLQAEHATVLDALTGLPNRAALLDRFAQVLASAKRQGSRFAFLFLDLDHFKTLNDQYGHVFGDRVLCLAATRMLSVVREVDTVSRYGGDEFLILLPGLQQPGDAETVAEKLVSSISAPMVLEGHVVGVTASVGIARYPEDGDTLEALLACADAAMYKAKRRRTRGLGSSGGPSLGAAAGANASGPPPSTRGITSYSEPTEYRIAQLREENEQLVVSARRAQELLAGAEQTQQRHATLLAAVAVELRNPLAPIRLAATRLGGPPADEQMLARVKSIFAEQLTQVSRSVGATVPGTNGLNLERRPVDLALVIEAALAAQQPLLDDRRQRFEFKRPVSALTVHGNVLALLQIVGNLLDNASRHTYHGGRIGVSVAFDSETLVMTVTNDGIDIATPLARRDFDPLGRDTQALGFDCGGLASSLMVVGALVHVLGGTFALHSTGVRCGSQIIVTLPKMPDSDAGAGTGGTSGPGR